MNKPLQELDAIHASQTTKDKTLHYVINKKHYSKSLFLIPVAVCLFLFFIFTPAHSKISSTPVAYVSLDINPSLELRLNQDNIVIDTVAYNKDAQKIIDKVKLQGQELQSAILILFNNQQYKNYLQDGLLEISIFADNEKLSATIQTLINNLLDENLKKDQYHCSQIDKTTHHNASSHHISGGKYQIIEDIMSYTSQYSLNDLKHLSIQELYSLLYTFDQDAVPSHCQPQSNQKHHRSHNHS